MSKDTPALPDKNKKTKKGAHLPGSEEVLQHGDQRVRAKKAKRSEGSVAMMGCRTVFSSSVIQSVAVVRVAIRPSKAQQAQS